MKHVVQALPILLILIITSSCAKIFNPYEESFGCPEGYHGSCDDVDTAHSKSIHSDEVWSPLVSSEEEPDRRTRANLPVYNYRAAKMSENRSLIEEPITPIMKPSKKMRLLVFGYADEETDFYSDRFIYFIAEPERWITPFNIMGGLTDGYGDPLFK